MAGHRAGHLHRHSAATDHRVPVMTVGGDLRRVNGSVRWYNEVLSLTQTNALVYFLASGGAGGVSIFQVSRTKCHLPSFFCITESHLPVSTTTPFTSTFM